MPANTPALKKSGNAPISAPSAAPIAAHNTMALTSSNPAPAALGGAGRAGRAGRRREGVGSVIVWARVVESFVHDEQRRAHGNSVRQR